MSYCELTGKEWLAGGRVSHSHVRTHRRYNINMRSVRLSSGLLNRKFCMQIAVSTQRVLDRYDSFDSFLLSRRNSELSSRALSLKKMLLSKMNESQATSPINKTTAKNTDIRSKKSAIGNIKS